MAKIFNKRSNETIENEASFKHEQEIIQYVENINKAKEEIGGGKELGGGVTSWNDLTDKPFGEEKTREDIIWNGEVTDSSVTIRPYMGGDVVDEYVMMKIELMNMMSSHTNHTSPKSNSHPPSSPLTRSICRIPLLSMATQNCCYPLNLVKNLKLLLVRMEH